MLVQRVAHVADDLCAVTAARVRVRVTATVESMMAQHSDAAHVESMVAAQRRGRSLAVDKPSAAVGPSVVQPAAVQLAAAPFALDNKPSAAGWPRGATCKS